MASVLAFLKALPALVGLFKEGIEAIKDLQDVITTKKFDEINTKLEETIKEVKNEKDRDNLLALASQLNKLQ